MLREKQRPADGQVECLDNGSHTAEKGAATRKNSKNEVTTNGAGLGPGTVLELSSESVDLEVPQATASPNVNGKVKIDTKVNILLVDDRSDKLLAVETILAPLGQNLVKARSGKEALRHLLQQDFAVILLDVAMPGMDGFETAAMIRKRLRSEHTPIIFVTSISNSENNIFHGYSLGAVDYIITPIVPDVLRTKVSVFVELHKQTELIKQQAEQLRLASEARHQRELAEHASRLEVETRRNRFFTLALELIGIGTFDGRLLQVNPAWERVLGHTEGELKGVEAINFVHPDDRSAVYTRLEKVKEGLPIDYFEVRCRHKDGSYRWLGWTAAPFPEERLICIFGRDTTARRMAEEAVKTLNDELTRRVNDLTEINKELESFSYSISHDLRAPLRSISSFTHVIRSQFESKLTAEGQDYLRRVENAAKYMDTLLIGLLDYSRLGRSEFELTAVNLQTALQDILASIDHEIQSRQARIEVTAPLGAIIGHPATVRLVLYNLVANGLKFVSPNATPQIRVRAESKGDFLRVWVEDQGIGIAAEHHPKIFGLFQRLHPATSYPGTGIGLAMVRKGVERMGGRIGFESELNHGSRFWFELRVANGAETTTPQPVEQRNDMFASAV